jgi:hypothetical protein
MAHYDHGPVVFPTVGPLLDSIRSQVRDSVGEIATGFYIWTFSVGFLDGFGGVQLDITPTGEGDSHTYLFMVLEIQEDLSVPVQQFISKPGFDAESTGFAYDSDLGGSWTLDQAENVWALLVVGLKEDMVTAWTNGTVGDETVQHTNPVPDKIQRATAWFVVSDEAGIFLSTERVLITMTTDDAASTYETTRYITGIDVSSPCVTVDTARIAEALETLVMLPGEASLNNRSQVWQMSTGFVTGS